MPLALLRVRQWVDLEFVPLPVSSCPNWAWYSANSIRSVTTRYIPCCTEVALSTLANPAKECTNPSHLTAPCCQLSIIAFQGCCLCTLLVNLLCLSPTAPCCSCHHQ